MSINSILYVFNEDSKMGSSILCSISKFGSSHWDFAESNFSEWFHWPGVLNKDPMFWLDGARLPHLVLLVLPLPEDEFGKLIIQ
jgi:hypothetical protein